MPLMALTGFQKERALLRNVTERSALTRLIRLARRGGRHQYPGDPPDNPPVALTARQKLPDRDGRAAPSEIPVSGPAWRRSAVEVSEDGEHPPVVVVGGLQVQLEEDGGDVLGHRTFGDDQPLGDGGV